MLSLRALLSYLNYRLSESPSTDEVAFEAIIAGINTLPEGAKMVLNSGRFSCELCGVILD